MGVITFLILVAVVVAVVAVVVVLAGNSGGDASEKRELKRDLTNSMARERLATNALRAIANGAGEPIIEASLALDSIEQYRMKEINS